MPDLSHLLSGLETERNKIARNSYKGWGLIILSFFVFFVVMGNWGALIPAIIAGAAALIPGIFILSRNSNLKQQYRLRFKQEIISALLTEVDHSLTLTPDSGITSTEFVNSQLFSTKPDRYHSEDLISGKAGKTSFYFAEVHAEYKTETRTKHGRQTHWHTILKGIVFTADFNKNFNGLTIVRPRDFGASISSWFAKNIYDFGDKNIVELENEYFNKHFVTYSTDQIEARYILTPALMDNIAALNNRTRNCVSLSFINSSIYIAFPLANNYFEPPVFKSLLRPDLLENDKAVLSFMYDIIKELDLNTRIWTKQ